MLDPVITQGIEHILLIVKGPGLSPSLPVSPWSVLREEEADWLSCHLTSLTRRHEGPKRLWSETIVMVSYFYRYCVFQNVYVCLTEGIVRHGLVLLVILTFCQADVVVPMTTYSLHIDLCVTNVW